MNSLSDTSDCQLRDLIVSDEPTVGPGVPLSVGIRALECSNCGTVVVADEEGTFCGTFDYTCGLRSKLPGYAGLLPDPRILSFRPDRKMIDVSAGDQTLCDFVDRRPITVEETATLTQLTALFVRHKVDAIPVLRGTRALGLVARTDLIEHVLFSRNRIAR